MTPDRQCVLYVAAAGYGKTTALQRLPGVHRRARDWLTAADLPAGPLLVDDLDALPTGDQRALLHRLAGRPLWLAARHPLHPAIDVRVTEHGAAALTLTGPQVSRVLREEHGLSDPELAREVAGLTAGWPALVHFAGAELTGPRSRPDDLPAALTAPGSPAATWLSEQVLGDLPAADAALLATAAALGPVDEPLATHLGLRPEPLRRLALRGLLVPDPGTGMRRVVPVLAALLGRPRPAPVDAAIAWYTTHGLPFAAADLLRAEGRPDELAALIERHGEAMLAAGRAADVVRLLRDRPRSPGLSLVYADALRMSGDAAGAEREFAPLLRDTRDPAVLWRAAMVPYMRADYPAALAICDRAGPEPADVFLLAARSSTLVMLDRTEEAAAVAARAITLAGDDDRARAAAHTAASLSAVGSRRAGHLGAALAAATAAGDLVQATRALVNQAESLIREAHYPEAYAAAARAVATGERGCPPGMFTAALANCGDALLHLGRYDEAAEHFERVVRVSHRTGLRRAAVGHWGLAEVHGRLGRWERSRTAFEEAAQLARADGDGQVLVPALTGLVRVLLDGPAPDPVAARAAADEAELAATGLLRSLALGALGWVAYAEGDLCAAGARAVAAVAAARHGRRADCLALALELLGTAGTDPAQAVAALHEAEAIWQAAGALPAADRVRVLLGRRPDADAAARWAARLAARRLIELGVPTVGGTELWLSGSTAAVRIRVLGGFDVLVDGRPVPLAAWRSRQARSLVKILVARRGRPAPRPELRELLWPDEDQHRTAHRLSVLLSAVRAVLDPGRRRPADHYVRADLTGIWLATGNVAVDALELIRDAAHADRLHRSGRDADAREMLTHVDQLYRGDAFVEEPYEEWADGLREEARAIRLGALRELARLHRRAGEPERAVDPLVRLLGTDPYDEAAHRELVEVLVAGGRHGEARRAFDRWHKAMRALDAPAPSRLVLGQASGVSLQ